MKNFIIGILGFGVLNSSFGIGAYWITQKPQEKAFISYRYIGDSKQGNTIYRVCISNQKGEFGKHIYRVWISFVPENTYKSIIQNLKHTQEQLKGFAKPIPQDKLKYYADSIACSSGMISLAQVDCQKKDITLISGRGNLKLNMVYHAYKKYKLNYDIYKQACTPGVLKIIYKR